MFPTLATVTLWASLGFAALVAFQAGARVMTGAATDSFSKLGYMLALLAIGLAVATAYMFGPDDQGTMSDLASMNMNLTRTWGPVTLLAGLAVGFTTLYMAIAPDSNDSVAAYKPVMFTPTPSPDGSPRAVSMPLPVATARPRREPSASTAPPGASPDRRDPPRPTTSPPVTSAAGAIDHGPPSRVSSPRLTPLPTDRMPALARTTSGPIPLPGHLRNRLQYLALTAELTAGGIDARREDGSSRLVLWRDVVGVVARRMPPELDGMTFIDIVSTADSTLRIVPWTRLTGEPIAAEGDARPRGVVERVVEHCPGAKLDPATRQFLETGEAAQLPDLDTLQAHDGRLA
jgi:hypothetical protein